MKKTEELKSLRDKDLTQLKEELVGVEKELLNLRFRKSVNQIPDSSIINKLKKKIARIETIAKEKELSQTSA
jgi:large subunit ribosomal protein L29